MDKARKNLLKTVAAGVLATTMAAVSVSGVLGCGKKKEKPVPDGAVRLTVNYYRPAADYTGYNMWIWADGQNGNGYQFTADATIKDKTWKTLTTDIQNVKTNGNAIGVIVRQSTAGNDWAWQTGDMMIPADKIVNNRCSIYLLQDDDTVYYSPDEVSFANRIKNARFTSFDSVYFDTSAKITAGSVFKIKDDADNVVATLDCSADANKSVVGENYATVKLPTELDMGKNYTVVDEPASFDENVNFLSCEVSKTRLYSSDKFNELYGYDGELGVEYSNSSSVFRVWSPAASAVKLNIYNAGANGQKTQTVDMVKAEKGVWSQTVNGDLNGNYYTYSVTVGGRTTEVVDPYARSGGKNGMRGMILDLDQTDPTGWSTQADPALGSNSEAVIYEAQLRDLTISPTSGVSEANRGKFLGLTEKGTTVNGVAGGKSTALDYLKELGVTEVHFQPLFDFASVDEGFTTATYNKDGEYNWGYDPLNYNMPEGSYSSDPNDGAKRVTEMKQMIMALHNAGIQVVMDVVYNHVSNARNSNFEALMPGYYFRMTNDGDYFNGSGCGNETASEHAMFRKFMIDSVKYWAEEYKIDGFRFDLMGLHDVKTMNELYDALAEINPDVIVYGEGWTGGTSGLSDTAAALQKNASKMPNIAVFNDMIRDGLKGSVFTMSDTGFVSGKAGTDAAVYVGAAGATDVLSSSIYVSLGGDKKAFASNPTQNINYVSAHDNSSLWDKLNASVNKDVDTLKAMNRLAATSILTSQGASFFLAGEELLRSKPTQKTNSYDNRPTAYVTDPAYYFSDNSYKSPDSVNAIDWTLRDTNSDMVEYYKALIAIKKSFPQFKIADKATLKNCLVVKDTTDASLADGVAVYAVKSPTSDEYAVVIINSNATAKTVSVPDGSYEVFVNGANATATVPTSISGGSVSVGAYSAIVMRAELSADAVSAWTYSVA